MDYYESKIQQLCGHTVLRTVNSANYRSRLQMDNNLAMVVCSDCAAKAAALLESSASMPAIFSLPELVGSPGQVSWARSVRARYAERASHAYAEAMRDGSKVALGVAKTILVHLSIESSRFWISHAKESLASRGFNFSTDLLVVLSRRTVGFAGRLGTFEALPGMARLGAGSTLLLQDYLSDPSQMDRLVERLVVPYALTSAAMTPAYRPQA